MDNKRKAIVEIIATLIELVQIKGVVPEGHLYAQLMPYGVNLESFEEICRTMAATGYVKRAGRLLVAA